VHAGVQPVGSAARSCPSSSMPVMPMPEAEFAGNAAPVAQARRGPVRQVSGQQRAGPSGE
jgi:hypothetical protein